MPGKRARSRTERAVLRNKQTEVQTDASEIYLEGSLLENVFDFKYVRFTASTDGDFRHVVAIRLALTSKGKIRTVVEDLRSKCTQINGGESIRCSRSVGPDSQSSKLATDRKELVSLKHSDAKCLARIFDIGVDEAYRSL